MRMLFKERLIISCVLLLAEYISTTRAGVQAERQIIQEAKRLGTTPRTLNKYDGRIDKNRKNDYEQDGKIWKRSKGIKNTGYDKTFIIRMDMRMKMDMSMTMKTISQAIYNYLAMSIKDKKYGQAIKFSRTK